jgi:hypothetical protein
MSGIEARRCAVCGTAAGRLEQHHLAARSNDPALLVTSCRPCHDVFTDWQWALGILRRESLEARAQHSDLERAWALFEGLALTVMMAAPIEHQPAWVLLGRAAGTFYKIREEQQGTDARWGPKPARTRSRRCWPDRRGHGDPAAVLGAILESGDRLLADDPDWQELRGHLLTRAEMAVSLSSTPTTWHPAVSMLETTLGSLAEANGPDDLESSRTDRERTLLAIADVLVRGGGEKLPGNAAVWADGAGRDPRRQPPDD